MGVVYCIENLVNFKRYIGLDSKGINKRWKDHCRKAKNENPCLLIDKKIKEYGESNFRYTILYISNLKDELMIMETYFINKLHSFIEFQKGYNLTYGGDSNPMDNNYIREKHAKIMKEKLSGKNHYLWGKKQSKDSNYKRSIALKGTRLGEHNPAKRFEVRKKISIAAKKRIGKLNPNFKYNIEKEDLFHYYIKDNHSLKETALYFNCSEATITRTLKKYNISKEIMIIDEKKLYNLYIKQNKSILYCSNYFNCSAYPIKQIIKRNCWYKEKRNRYKMKFKINYQGKEIIIKKLPNGKFEKPNLSQFCQIQSSVTWLDDCRVPIKSDDPNINLSAYDYKGHGHTFANPDHKRSNDDLPDMGFHNSKGRVPANLLISDSVLDTGKETKSHTNNPEAWKTGYNISYTYTEGKGGIGGNINDTNRHDDEGDFSRYFDLDNWFDKKVMENMPETFPFLYVPKASQTERNLGLEENENNLRPSGILWEKGSKDPLGQKRKTKGNIHTTVKPIKLGCYLVTLGSRKNDIILDPFMGSGSFGLSTLIMNRRFVGCELSEQYHAIAKKRFDALPDYKHEPRFKPDNWKPVEQKSLKEFFT